MLNHKLSPEVAQVNPQKQNEISHVPSRTVVQVLCRAHPSRARWRPALAPVVDCPESVAKMSAVGIGQPQVIARAGAGGEVVGVSMGPGARQVTCTLVPQGVQVVDMASATCVLSWGLKGRAPLLPAAVVGSGERLVLACEDGTVLSWRAREGTDLADADVMKASKKKGTRLRMLLVDPTLEAVLLVSGDGQVLPVSRLLVVLCPAREQKSTCDAPCPAC